MDTNLAKAYIKSKLGLQLEKFNNNTILTYTILESIFDKTLLDETIQELQTEEGIKTNELIKELMNDKTKPVKNIINKQISIFKSELEQLLELPTERAIEVLQDDYLEKKHLDLVESLHKNGTVKIKKI